MGHLHDKGSIQGININPGPNIKERKLWKYKENGRTAKKNKYIGLILKKYQETNKIKYGKYKNSTKNMRTQNYNHLKFVQK